MEAAISEAWAARCRLGGWTAAAVLLVAGGVSGTVYVV